MNHPAATTQAFASLFPAPRGRAVELAITSLRESFGGRLARVILYGSFARGTGTERSDIDLLVVLGGAEDPRADRNASIEVAAEVGATTGELISVHTVSEEEYRTRSQPLLINIRREGVVLA